jgi:hypothetical protein
MHDSCSSFLGGGDAPREQSSRVTNNESRSLGPQAKVAASLKYSDVDVGQQQEISNFFRENFSQHILQGCNPDSSSKAAIYAQQQRCDAQGLRWTTHEQLYIPHRDNLRFECFESVHKHPFSGHFGGQRTLHKASQLFHWPNLSVTSSCNQA